MDQPQDESNIRQDLHVIRNDQSELARVLWRALAGLLVLTASFGVYLLRQDMLLNKQAAMQKPMVGEAVKRNEELLAVAAEFQKYGAGHADYATNVLNRFGLKPLPATNSPSGR